MAEVLPILLGPCRAQLRQPALSSQVISALSLPVQVDATCMIDTQKDASECCSTQPEGPPCSSPSSYSTCHLGTSCPGRVMTLAELCVGPSGTYMTVEGDCRVNVCEASQHPRRLAMASQDASLREKVQCTRPDLNGGPPPPPPLLPLSRAGPSRAAARCHHTRSGHSPSIISGIQLSKPVILCCTHAYYLGTDVHLSCRTHTVGNSSSKKDNWESQILQITRWKTINSLPFRYLCSEPATSLMPTSRRPSKQS